MSSFVEQLREHAVQDLLSINAFKAGWSKRARFFGAKLPLSGRITKTQILELGSELAGAYRVIKKKNRRQGDLSSGGYVWEALVAWYMNLCLLGTSAVCLRRGRLSPSPIVDALSVVYQNNVLKDEADVLLLSCPQLALLPRVSSQQGLIELLNKTVADNFKDVGVINIQCKTNWNDNAQVPMLWNMLYNQARKGAVIPNGFTIGRNGFNLMNLGQWGYAFATVPTQKKAPDGYKADGVEVLRVKSMSAGNYWGYPTKSSVCSSLSELFNYFQHNSRVFPNVSDVGVEAARVVKARGRCAYDLGKLLLPLP
jgi:hypothetical protein